MNDEPCSKCAHYHDRKLRGGAQERSAPYGWCGAKSTYAHGDKDRPDGAKVAAVGALAAPVIVYPSQIVRGCPSRRRP